MWYNGAVYFQGLVLQLDVQQDQYVGPLTEQAGIRVLLHEQGSMIFPFEEGFSVSPGISTSVGIKKVRKAFYLQIYLFYLFIYLQKFAINKVRTKLTT